jgi:hypothetical protein
VSQGVAPQARWRKAIRALNVRYRRPYTARQTSVSSNLMIGKNPLWGSKQHGHSIATIRRPLSFTPYFGRVLHAMTASSSAAWMLFVSSGS